MPSRKVSSAPRLSGTALRTVVGLSGFEPFRRMLSAQIRNDLNIRNALELDTATRSPMPLDYKPIKARPARSISGNLPPPKLPGSIPSSRTWTDLYATGQTNPVESISRALAKAKAMEEEQPTMGCFSSLDEEGAMRDAKASAERWAKGEPLGPLDGVPIPVKEMVDIKGANFRLGTSFIPHDPNTEDATSVARLRAAGAIILGHTAMVEMGMSPMGTNAKRIMPRNAHAVDRVAGGSSTGSAVAVASGLAPVTLACDGGGSVRIPAAFNGIFSIKPTAGRISRHCDGFGGSMDHFGPIGASAHDLAIFLDACAGPDPLDPITDGSPKPVSGEFTASLGRGVKGLKIGILQSEIEAAEPEIAKACRHALAGLAAEGAELVDLELPLGPYASGIGFTVIGLETYAELAEQRSNGWRDLGDDTRLMMRFFQTFAPGDYIEAECLRATLRSQCADLLRQVDVLALPTTATEAPRVSEAQFRSGFSDVAALEAACRFTFLGNLTGLPCGQAPVGSGGSGLPVGLQIIGDAFDEAAVLAVLAHLERSQIASVRAPRISANPLS